MDVKNRRCVAGLARAAMIAVIPLTCAAVRAQVTPPGEYLGYPVGADYRLTTYESAIGYFELVAGQSDRMIVREAGPTSMGRSMRYAVISSAANLARLDRWQEIARNLSLGRGITPQQAERLAAEGRAIAWIDVGLHATECAPSEHAIQLVYDLVTGEDEMTRRIRDQVVTLVIFANPDGMTLVADWYMQHVGTEYERSGLPWLYNRYIGHDNNRDSFNVTQVETRNIAHLQNHEWFPNVVYNHHQTAPFPTRIWIPPYGEPTNPNKPAMVIRWENLIGANMGLAFEENGQPGAVSRMSFDAWYPGFMTQIATTHNTPSILTETALFYLATPGDYSREQVERAGRGAYAGFVRSAFYPHPWEGGHWGIGDAVAYCLTASKAVLDACARYRSEMLLSKYRLAVDHLEHYAAEPPFGWIVPADQRDATTTARMFDKLMLGGVEIYRAEAAFESGGRTWPAGTWIVPTAQPFGGFVRTMFERQDYPDLRRMTQLWQGVPSGVDVSEAGPMRPYDVAGWTLPLQMGVACEELDAPVDVTMSRLEAVPWPEGGVTGRGGAFLFSPADLGAYTAAAALQAAGGRISRTREAFTLDGSAFPAGTFAVSGTGAADAAAIAARTGVTMVRGRAGGSPAPVAALRLGHYAPWQGSMDEGWMRWILDEYGLPYTRLRNERVRAGALGEEFSVISLASLNARSIVEGNPPGRVPPEYAGGIGEEGVENLKEFVRAGGTLVCNESSCAFAIEAFGLPIEDVSRQTGRDGFYAAGSVVRMTYDPAHPVAWGMPADGIAFWQRGALFQIAGSEGADPLIGEIAVVAHFPDDPEAEILLSGYLEHPELIAGRPTVLTVAYGEGRIVLFGFTFHNRAQAYAAFPLFFNTLFLPE